MVMRDMVARGQMPDSHRCLRLVSKLGTGLAAVTADGVAEAAARMFSALGWMESLCQAWPDMEVGRTCCSMVSIFHRRGFTDLALRAVAWLRQRHYEIPICTLALAIDVCLQDERLPEAKELFKEAQVLLTQILTAPNEITCGPRGYYVESGQCKVAEVEKRQAEDDEEDETGISGSNSGANDSPSLSAKESPADFPTDKTTLCTDGLPNWLSSREGHLMALIAGHVAVLNRLAPVESSHWQDEFDMQDSVSQQTPSHVSELDWIKEVLEHGLELLESLCSEVQELGAAGRSVLVGPLETLGQRWRLAQLHLLMPVARLAQKLEPSAAAKKFEGLIRSRGFDASQLARRGLKERDPFSEDRSERINLEQPGPPPDEDTADAMQTLVNLTVKLHCQRRPSREDVDEILRTMGRRKGRRAGLVQETFRLANDLATHGLEVLRASSEEDQAFLAEVRDAQTQEDVEMSASSANKLFFRHLTPDTESCAAVIEALFACGAAAAAESMLLRCQSAFPPNPALYSAVIFGRLYCGDGQGAVDAILEMDRAGFAPHQRFILRCLRYMGAFHREALLLIDRLGFPMMQQKMLHILMETCISSPQPSACVLDVYHSLLEKGYSPTPDTHFALLKALCGISDAQCAIDELHKMQTKCILPEFIGFDLLLLDCFGLAASARRASQVIEARRRWVLEVSAALLSEPTDHVHLICQELQRRHADFDGSCQAKFRVAGEEQEAATDAACRHEVQDGPDEDEEVDVDAAENMNRQASDEVADQDPEAECWFGPRYKYTWVLNAYCAALPLRLAALKASHYLVFRYSLVRSGTQKAALQEELDRGMSLDYAELARELHQKLQLDAWNLQEHLRLGQASTGVLEEGCWQPMSFILLILMHLDQLEVVEGTQVRLLRMLFRSLPVGARCLSEMHADFLQRRAGQLSPAVLTELIRACSVCDGGHSPFGSDQGRRMLADTVRDHYLTRAPGGEPIKLSTSLRFVRTHELADLIADDVLFIPVLCSLQDGQPQHAYNLGEGDLQLQLRLVSYAICKGKRLAAGRLTERFGLLDHMDGITEVPGWSDAQGPFKDVCIACVREAEEAEEKELRAASDRKMAAAAEEDAICLQLPDAVAANVVLVSTEADLLHIRARLMALADVSQPAEPNVDELIHRCGSCIGLDTEWKPFLEKRGGMQKHRRSNQSATSMEPCSTLQLAVEDFIVIFDLLALAPAGKSTAQMLSAVLASLFCHRGIVKLGFGLQNDLQRLAASYPHLECFRRILGTLDLQEVLMEARRSKGQTTGLSALCLEFIGSPLSKRLQTSDWGARPLSREQLSYAALDAHCLLTLARRLHASPESIRTCMQLQDLKVQLLAGKMVVSVGSDAEESPSLAVDMEAISKVSQDITSKGAEIRAMKAAGKAKSAWQAEVAVLLQLKARFRQLAGVDWVPPVSAG
ncbi:EXD3 [Symbiodinium microadriaticum]|nr:EXD3 [Symbiodinium microadriaticum]